MHGISEANQRTQPAFQAIRKTGRYVEFPEQALTKTIYYPALKKTLKWIGISLTKKIIRWRYRQSHSLWQCGLTSAGLTSALNTLATRG